MTKRHSIFEVVREAAERSDERHVPLHGSMGAELEDYARRVGIDDLPDEHLRIVLTAIVDDAIELVEERPGVYQGVNAGAIRQAIEKRCDSAWTACRRAAFNILAEHGIEAVHLEASEPDTVEDFLLADDLGSATGEI